MSVTYFLTALITFLDQASVTLSTPTTRSTTHNLQQPTDSSASKQSAWNAPSVAADKAEVFTDAIDDHHRARLLAVTAPHSGDWLHALPISSCGLRLDDETIRVSVKLRLGLNLCEVHRCPCGTQVDARGTHGLACKLSSGCMARHHHINPLWGKWGI